MTATERYIRHSHSRGKALVWRSQARGIEQLLLSNQSFALCTPTGSGKTRVAELAILQNLFTQNDSEEFSNTQPLVLYLVPSRALATEVEANLSRVLKNTAPPNHQIIVTGLYGGTDWGPTDAWLNSSEPTVLICTYEKGEALMKFLGSLFLQRVTLVIIDEAHMVQFGGNRENLRNAESRELRLEFLGARLFTYLNEERSRIIALSAVASEAESALAKWITRQEDGLPIKTNYRSTRQLIGHLECTSNRGFTIRYDLLDGAQLSFQENDTDALGATPYIPSPFPPYPVVVGNKFGDGESPGKRLRPYLFWAAMHLASPNERTQNRAVLISITENIDWYTEDFLNLLNKSWANSDKPLFFQEPSDPRKKALWERCIRSCEDYFGSVSREYQLLCKGIVVHHGKMPGLMARLLIELIQEQVISLVIATSTLSDGVNLPFETVLIPSLKRYSGNLSIREFSNLAGRAGRPGFGTEGRSLVLLLSQSSDRKVRKERKVYTDLIRGIEAQRDAEPSTSGANSALASLITYLEEKWSTIPSASQNSDFLSWLEQTAPQAFTEPSEDNAEFEAIEILDSLDSILLTGVVELEKVSPQELNLTELEERLQQIWRQTYAHYASQEEERLEHVFVRRGSALKTTIYPDSSERRRLYQTSLPPRSGRQLLDVYPFIKAHLETGIQYSVRTTEEQLHYVQETIRLLNRVSKFRIEDPRSPADLTWEQLVQWWLCHQNAPRQPTKTQISTWHKFVSAKLNYRFNWGIGSVIALAIDEASAGQLMELSLENWELTGLPWIVLWIKELIVWGTLDPVAAYLLSRSNIVDTRQEAERLSRQYYQQAEDQEPNAKLDASNIKNWVSQLISERTHELATPRLMPSTTRVTLLRDFSNVSTQLFRVVPVETENDIRWFDPAGFPLATNQRTEEWQSRYLKEYDFTLDVTAETVTPRAYT